MPILEKDLQFYKSEVMLDEDDGGGRITNKAVLTKKSNEIFQDTGEADEAYGDVSIRKIYGKVDSLDGDTAFGFSALVVKPPLNPKVSISLFRTGSHTDKRADARNRMESYLTKSGIARAMLCNDHYVGQRVLQVARKGENVETLEVNSTYALYSNEGKATQKYQYVRITEKVSSTVVMIDINGQEKPITVDVFTISDSLRYDFLGNDYTDVYYVRPKNENVAIIRDTRASDTSEYFSVTPLKAPANLGDFVVKASSIFTQLVPSAQTETPMLDLDVNGFSTALVRGDNGDVTYPINVPVNRTQAIYLGSPIYPNSLSFTYNGKTYKDVGGQIKDDAGTLVVGTINYQNGSLVWNENMPTASAASLVFSFKPCGIPTSNPHTILFRVTQENRGYNYIGTLLPLPAPASLVVSYVAQRKVYYLYDDGSGRLSGADSSFGTGTINYTTGTLLLTCGAQPDVDTGILITWSNPVDSFNRGDLNVKPAYVDITFPLDKDAQGNDTALATGLQITWTDGANSREVYDNHAGLLTGDATGIVNYKTGEVRLYLQKLPLGGTEFTLYRKRTLPVGISSGALTPSNGAVSFSIPPQDLMRGSINGEITLYCNIPSSVAGAQGWSLSGNLYFRDKPSSVAATSSDLVVSESPDSVVGTIDYTTGLVTLNPNVALPCYQPLYSRAPLYSMSYVGSGSVSGSSITTVGGSGSASQVKQQKTSPWLGYVSA